MTRLTTVACSLLAFQTRSLGERYSRLEVGWGQLRGGDCNFSARSERVGHDLANCLAIKAGRAKRAGLNFLSFASKAKVERQVLLTVTENCPAIAHRMYASAQTAIRTKNKITSIASTD